MRNIFILVLVVLSVACGKKDTSPATCPTTCYYKGVFAVVSGFTKEDADTVYLRAYKANHRFDSLVDETLHVTPDSATRSATPDINLGYLSTDNDYVISVPATSQSFSLAMTVGKIVDTIPCNSRTCYIFSPGAFATGGKSSLVVAAGEFYMYFMK
jgi:hypothetical protein